MEHIPFTGGVGGGDGLPGAELGSPFIFTDVEEFKKAVTAGNTISDVASLTGGGALRLQSIEQTLLRTIQENDHFVIFNKLDKSNATATVDEYTKKDQIGGFPGSGFNDELGDIAESQGNYKREVGYVKYLMTKRQVSVVQSSQRTLVDTIAEEKVDATLELLTSVNWGIYYGDSSVVPLEFDGIRKQLEAAGDSDLIYNADGSGLSYVAEELINLATIVAMQGRWGRVTDLFCSAQVQAAEIDQKLDPAFRIGGGGQVTGDAVKVGTPVGQIRTSAGNINVNRDLFIEEGGKPWSARGGTYPTLVTALALTAPSVASPVAASGTAANKFTAARAGNYYYGVESISKAGRSTCTIPAQVAVSSGQKVTVTITNPANANVTGFCIYRSRKNGTNAASDLREIKRIPRTGAADGVATTAFVDENLDIPGTSQVFLNTMRNNAITFRRLLPMTMFPLYPTSTATKPWAQLMFGYLRLAKQKQHAIIKNVLPKSAAWLPF